MAIYHLNAKTGSKNKGQSARAKSDYITRTGKYGDRDNELVGHVSLNMPSWAEQNPREFWDAADEHERANGRLFREVEFALPVELSRHQQTQLAMQFAHELVGDKLPATLAFHRGGEDKNPHVHLMFSERENDGIERTPAQFFRRYNAKQPELGGARKTEATKPRSWLEEVRRVWADMANTSLNRAGFQQSIDHRSHEARGIETLPSVHLGSCSRGMAGRGKLTPAAQRYSEREAAREQITGLQMERAAVEREELALKKLRNQGPEPGPRPRR